MASTSRVVTPLQKRRNAALHGLSGQNLLARSRQQCPANHTGNQRFRRSTSVLRQTRMAEVARKAAKADDEAKAAIVGRVMQRSD